MPGSAVLGASLIDELIPDVVDGLRGDLHPEFGNRAFRASTVRRTWSGARTGQGQVVDTEIEIDPQPFVQLWSTVSGVRFELEPCGLETSGLATLTEVSLTYTEAELIGPRGSQPNALKANEQWLWKITDAHGQEMRPKFFIIDKPPYPDREKTIGWYVFLRVADV